MTYVYRLESCWSSWETFFDSLLMYTGERIRIDKFIDHKWPLRPSPGQAVCGLWVLKDFGDAYALQRREIDDSTLSAAAERAAARLRGASDDYMPSLRFCTRISIEAFKGDKLYPDNPMIDYYSSSCFHPRIFDTLGKTWSKDGESLRIPHVTIPDTFVEIFLDGAWYRKSRRFGEIFRRLVLQEGTAQLVLLDEASEDAPIGDCTVLEKRLKAQALSDDVAVGDTWRSWRRFLHW